MDIQAALAGAQLVVAIITLLGAVKSGYNGFIRDTYNSLQRVGEMETKISSVYDRQEDIAEAVYFLSEEMQEHNGHDVDPEGIRKELDVDEGLSRFEDSSRTD